MLSSSFPYLILGFGLASLLLAAAWVHYRIRSRRPRTLHTIRDFQSALQAISPEHHRRREAQARRDAAAAAARRSVAERRWTSA